MADPGEIIRVGLRYAAPNSSIMENIFHYVVTGVGSTDEDVLDRIEIFLNDGWGDKWKDLAADAVTLEDASVDVVNVDGTVVRAIGVILLGIAGTLIPGVTSAAVSAYMLLKTVIPKVRGVKYVPGLSEQVIEDGILSAAGLVDIAFLLIQYGAELGIGGNTDLKPGVPSKSTNVFVEFEDTGLIEDVPAYQRRRKPHVGS